MANPTNDNATYRQKRLAGELRALRGAQTSAQVKTGTGVTPSKLSRIESCHVRAHPSDVDLLASYYGASSSDVAHLVQQAEEAWTSSVMREFVGINWANTFRNHLELESDATRIDSWTIDLVPGLMQTDAYATTLIKGRPDVPEDELDERLEFRRRRRRRVYSGELTLWAVIGETVLHQEVGGPDVLADQLQYLADPPPNVTVQVLPFSAGAHPGLGSSFHIFTFPKFSGVIYQETIKKALYQDDPETVERYENMMEHIKASALSVRDSRQRILSRIEGV